MSHIPEEKLLRHIADGVADLTPERAEALWEQPVEPADRSAWYLAPRPKARKKRSFLGAVAACIALFMVSGILFQTMPSASVYLDVNPSVTLRVNYRNRVTEAIACNEDAAGILGDMDLKNTDLDVALYAILGSMVHHGYLSETQDTILVSVHSANTGRAKALETEVSDMVAQNLHQMIHAGEVLSCQVNDQELDHHREDSGFTPGKTAFIDELQAKYPQLEKEDLEEMSLEEIVSLLTASHLDYSDYMDDDEDDGDDDEDEPDTPDEEETSDDDEDEDEEDDDED